METKSLAASTGQSGAQGAASPATGPATAQAGSALLATGLTKAAVLMVVLGEDAAKQIYPLLTEPEVERLTQAISTMRSFPTTASQAVLQEFRELMDTQQYLNFGGLEYAERILVKSFGPQRADALLTQVARSREESRGNLAMLQQADAQQLARFLEHEHPQTVAMVVSHMDPRAASKLLSNLPPELRVAAIRRLAGMRQFSDEMAQTVGHTLQRRFESLGKQKRKSYSGFKVVADLMNRMDSAASKDILEKIESDDSPTAFSIRNLMFTFEDFSTVPAISMRELVANIDKMVLATALKGSEETLRAHFYSAMSSRAAEMLREDMEVMGPVRGREVSKAQTEILQLARSLESEGKLILKPQTDDDFIE